MRSSKKIVALLAGLALAAVGATGCSTYTPDTATEEVEVVEETGGDEAEEETEEAPSDAGSEAEDAEAAATVAGDFLTAWITLIIGGDEQAAKQYEDADGDVDKFYDSLAISKYFSLEGMSKSETQVFKDEFYYLGTMDMLDYDPDAPTVSFVLPADAVTIDGDTATADMTQGVATLNGEVIEDTAEGIGFPEIGLVREGGEWKISGSSFLEAAENIPDSE